MYPCVQTTLRSATSAGGHTASSGRIVLCWTFEPIQPQPVPLVTDTLRHPPAHRNGSERGTAPDQVRAQIARCGDPRAFRCEGGRAAVFHKIRAFDAAAKPGVQLFTAPDCSSMTGKGGVQYGIGSSFCLETQHFADAMNHENFPSIVLQAGEVFSSETIYRFRVE